MYVQRTCLEYMSSVKGLHIGLCISEQLKYIDVLYSVCTDMYCTYSTGQVHRQMGHDGAISGGKRKGNAGTGEGP